MCAVLLASCGTRCKGCSGPWNLRHVDVKDDDIAASNIARAAQGHGI